MFSRRKDEVSIVSSSVDRVHVGCGPKNLKEGWCNVDIRNFKGVDKVLDVTEEWPFTELRYVYGEHFIEHLSIEGAISFLVNAGASLTNGGILRLTTPNLAWVVKTHYKTDKTYSTEERMRQVCAANRAFYGWGHQFLYDTATLSELLRAVGYTDIKVCGYGESGCIDLQGIENHGGYSVFETEPNTIILEATKTGEILFSPELSQYLEENFLRYVRAGH